MKIRRGNIPYSGRPLKVRWLYLLAHTFRVIGWKLLRLAEKHDPSRRNIMDVFRSDEAMKTFGVQRSSSK